MIRCDKYTIFLYQENLKTKNLKSKAKKETEGETIFVIEC